IAAEGIAPVDDAGQVTSAHEDVIAVQIRVHQAALSGRWRQIVVDLIDEELGQHAQAAMARSAGGTQRAEDIAAPDGLAGTLQGMNLAQRGTELSSDHSLPVTRAVTRFTPRGPGKPRRDDVRPPPAGLEQVAVRHMPGRE